jgi:hypothetical protein
MTAYLNDWANGQADQMMFDFRIDEAALDGAEVIVAAYLEEEGMGDAYVLFRRDGKLWEVHGCHCSCFGLEGQWEPEEADRDVIMHRLKGGYWGRDGGVDAAIVAALA